VGIRKTSAQTVRHNNEKPFKQGLFTFLIKQHKHAITQQPSAVITRQQKAMNQPAALLRLIFAI
jgi:hypothetical protein